MQNSKDSFQCVIYSNILNRIFDHLLFELWTILRMSLKIKHFFTFIFSIWQHNQSGVMKKIFSIILLTFCEYKSFKVYLVFGVFSSLKYF